MRLYRRSGDATVTELAPFSPFLLLADRDLVKDAGGLLAVAPLEGPGHLCWRALFASWGHAPRARGSCRGRSGPPSNVARGPDLFPGDPGHQDLPQTRRTPLRWPLLRR